MVRLAKGILIWMSVETVVVGSLSGDGSFDWRETLSAIGLARPDGEDMSLTDFRESVYSGEGWRTVVTECAEDEDR